MYGRSPIYRISYFLFFAFSFPIAFAEHICTRHLQRSINLLMANPLPAIFLIFRFLTGFCGSAFLSVAAGSVSDMFTNEKVAMYANFKHFFAFLRQPNFGLPFLSPMAVYSTSPFLGPVLVSAPTLSRSTLR